MNRVISTFPAFIRSYFLRKGNCVFVWQLCWSDKWSIVVRIGSTRNCIHFYTNELFRAIYNLSIESLNHFHPHLAYSHKKVIFSPSTTDCVTLEVRFKGRKRYVSETPTMKVLSKAHMLSRYNDVRSFYCMMLYRNIGWGEFIECYFSSTFNAKLTEFCIKTLIYGRINWTRHIYVYEINGYMAYTAELMLVLMDAFLTLFGIFVKENRYNQYDIWPDPVLGEHWFLCGTYIRVVCCVWSIWPLLSFKDQPVWVVFHVNVW